MLQNTQQNLQLVLLDQIQNTIYNSLLTTHNTMENVNIEESHLQAQDQYTLKGVALMRILRIQISH